MKRLGYTKFAAQGGDWGAIIVDLMGLQLRRSCSAFTPTCRESFQPTLTGRLFPGHRPQRVCRPTRNSHTSVCSSYIKRESPTGTRWGCDRRHYTESRTHPSALRLISLITMRAATTYRTRLRRKNRGPHARRHPRQHHDHLVDEHGDFRRPSLLGVFWERVFQCQRRLHPGCRERLP